MSAEWIEIPAQRVLRVPMTTIVNEFSVVTADGQPANVGWAEKIHRVIRKSDGRVFKLADYVPACSPSESYMYLQDL